MNEVMETEDEITTNPRQLYKRFEDMIARGDTNLDKTGGKKWPFRIIKYCQ